MNTNILSDNFEFKEGALSHINKCFILGTGPTINKINLNALIDEFTIGVNRIVYSGFHPNIICATDPVILNKELIEKYNESSSRFVFANHFAKKAIDGGFFQSKILKTYEIKFVSVYGDAYLDYYDKKKFEYVTQAYNVIGDSAIPLTMFLGIKNIYILGMDEYWNPYNIKEREFFSNNVERNAHIWVLDIKRRDMCFSKIDFYAGINGYKIENLSPGSAIKGFKKSDACEKFPKIINTTPLYLKGCFIKFNNNIYKILGANNKNDDAFSFRNVNSQLFIRHKDGVIIESGSSCNSHFFDDDSSFYIETSFTDKNKVSLRSTNMRNHYVVKDVFLDRYFIRPLNADFIASDSSFEFFS